MKMPSIFPVASHTDNVGPGSTFVAIRGLNFDGHNYIDLALEKGAIKIVKESKATPNTRKILAELSAQAAGYPAKKVKLLGVTGTKGKTTSSYLMHYLLKQAGYKTALLSTIKNCILDDDIPATMTTAQPDYLHQFFKLCVEAEVEYVIMEIAAQATTFNRLETLEFDGLIFTNLDREHAELYPTMEEYFEAKAKIFEYTKSDCAMIVNGDDVYGEKLIKRYPNAFSLSIKNWEEGSVTVGDQKYSYSNLPGKFNAYNLVGVLLLLKNLGVEVNKNIGPLPAIPGRLQKIELPNGAQAYIDYAHTPGSFKSLFSTVRLWTKHLIVIFGAGGGKDHQKRPLMGSIAEQFADQIILTDDNPRQENPKEIIQDILAGISKPSKIIVEHNRQKAIEKAYGISQKGSIILILGKGPDEHQIIGTKKIPFSEKGILENL